TALCFLSAQQNKVDSLTALLKKDKADTSRIVHLNNLGWELMYNNPDTSILLGTEALSLADQLFSHSSSQKIQDPGPKKFYAVSFQNMGVFYQIKGNYPKALDYSLKSLKIYEELNEEAKNPISKTSAQKGMASCFLNIGLVYKDQNDNEKSLSYYMKALKIDEELGMKMEMAAALGNIGVVYYDEATAAGAKPNDTLYKKAFENYFKVLHLSEEIGNKGYQAIALGNIGNVYDDQARAAKIQKDNAASDTLSKKAFYYYFKALQMDEKIGNKNGVARHFSNIGALYTSIGKLKEAEFYLKKAIAIDDSTDALNDLRQDEETLSQLYDSTGKSATEKKQFEDASKYFKLAMIHYKKAMQLKDTIFSQENRKELTRKEMNFMFEAKEAKMKAERDKEIAVSEAENKKKNIILFSVALGLLLALIFSIYMVRAFVQKKKDNTKITKQKEEIELQRNELSLKNKHITDSINYAKRIQDAILPSEEEFNKYFSGHFIFFQPRETVSGDFYWLAADHKKIIFAAADCTGHGVPGAFMSMIGNTLLNQIVNEKKIFQPAEILNHLNEGVVQALHQESRSQDDGMDISVCLFDKENNRLVFAGANHTLYFIQNGTMNEISGDIFSIGSMFGKENFSFSQKEVPLNDISKVYFSTDGFTDQAGGANKKKFLARQMKELFLQVHTLPMAEQKAVVSKRFEEWKASLAQTDDVLVEGLKI
ncbi:MAG TPA: SpoIIE family protein phosphatase, partial [Bacteroidia bacterium]